uniref:Uncharacterized protein n=1 Tax=Acrobeloides nanus TaxID=290746 RepID=A0A914CJH7_9BILA
MRRHLLDEREMRKKERQKENYIERMQSFEGSNIIWPDAQLLCSICLNLRESMKNDSVIQCDKCGVAVHEICYMVEDFNEVESQDSSATTEPWFCEPCLFGLAEPPFCELCPNRYGAFKRADVGGQWVHLACALYTPGITFGDVDQVDVVDDSSINIFEAVREHDWKMCVCCFHYDDVELEEYRYLLLVIVVHAYSKK